MVDLELKKSLPLDKSYQRVIEDLNRWHTNTVAQLNEMHDNILFDMKRTLDDVHHFASFTNELLIEQENQLKKAKSNEEIDIIQERINQIISEVQFLQLLSFRLNYDSVKFNGKLSINYNNNEIKSNTSLMPTFPCFSTTSQKISDSFELSTNNKQSILLHTKYRFLISRIDGIELKKKLLPVFHLTFYSNELINECVLTFNVSNLDSSLKTFTLYWNLFPNHYEIRMLITPDNASFLMDKLNEISCSLLKRFQLNQIKIFSNSCPKSDERILLINGKQRDLIKDCVEEIYFNIEENNKKQYTKQNIKLYNPANLSNDDINEIILSNLDYGGFITKQTTLTSVHHSQMHVTEDEESDDDDDDDNDDDDLWDENDEWWNFRNTRDNNTDIIQREMIISNKYAGVVIGVNASCIERIKQKTGAFVYINGETNDLKRTVIMKGTREQVDRAYACIENLIERYINDKSSMKQQHLHGKHKEK
ncbi:unnamed protein product [Rotaria sp. Silwood1]|nr:unnamed protein product [Rotaria sp. Silwood1]